MTVLKRVAAVAVLLFVVAAALGLWRAHDAGYRAYVVRTGSMSPTYPPGDLVLDRPVQGPVARGQVITFQHSARPDLVTHRVAAVQGGEYHTKGDANRTADAWTIHQEQVHGVVATHLPRMGYLVVFLRQPLGILGVMTSALSLFLLWGLFFPPRAPAQRVEGRGTARRRMPSASVLSS